MRTVRIRALAAALALLAPRAALGDPPPPAPGAEGTAKTPDAPQPSDMTDGGGASRDAEAIAKRAFEAYNRGDYKTAVALYDQALKLAPAAALYFNIASIYDKKLASPEQAITYYRKCLASPDTNADLTLKSIARIQLLSQRPSDAVPPPQVKAAPLPVPTEAPGHGMRVAGVVTGVIGLAVLGAGLGFGLNAKLKLDDARKDCDGKQCFTQAGFDAMGAASTSATFATALSSAGGVALGVGIGLYVFAPRRAEVLKGPRAALRLTPILSPTGAGFTLSGAFF